MFLGALILKQSPNDLKQYQAITLKNGLRVLLIQNSETSKSAAALAVNVGHFQDPEDRQGLAHFLEHMLFLGTKNFPDGSEYQKFINQYGGSHNAWTATEHTCFFFDINHQHFESALTRFSEFFTCPLLSEEFVIKERQNIDAEFALKLKDDIRRLYDVHKETINQQHPFSKFSVGTLDTLADRNGQCISTEIQAFFNTFYRADYMTLALEGPQSLKELKTLAEQYFNDIRPACEPLGKIAQPLYLPVHQGIKIDVCPVKNNHQLIISFAMESIDQYYQDKPESVLAYLLGHEGQGSILSLLKKQQWAMGLTAGSGINGSNFKDFNISIRLTELGEAHIDDIVDIVFCYVATLKADSISEHYYQEKQNISELSFLYHEKSSPLDSVSLLVLNMQHYPVEDYLFGDYIMAGISQERTNKLLNAINVDNMRIIHVSQKNNFNNKSFWYQVPYQVTTILPEQLTHWRDLSNATATSPWFSELTLPKKNPYIVKNPQVYSQGIASKTVTKKKIIEEKTLLPKKLIAENGFTAWYKKDNTFNVPKGYLYIGIDSPYTVASRENIAMTRLFVELYTDTVIEENYDAELAGIHYHLYAHQGGVTLQISGVSEKQNLLLPKLLHRLKNHSVTQEHFELFKRQLIKQWKNSDKSKSISQLFANLSSLMQPHNPTTAELSAVLIKLTYQQYKHFTQQLFTKITVEMLIHGNWLECHAHDIVNNVKNAFVNAVDNIYAVQCPVVDIHNEQTLLLPIPLTDHDHASVVYTPLLTNDNKSIALTMITSHLLSPMFFHKMRTEKQYGYLVGVGYVPINRYPGIACYIQSPHTDPISLAIAMDEFIVSSHHALSEISDDDWQNLIQGLAGQLQEHDQNLRIKSLRFWSAICSKDLEFENKKQLIETILNITLFDIKQFIKTTLIPNNNPDRVIIYSLKEENTKASNNAEMQLNGKIISNLSEFVKKSQRKF